MAIQSIQIGQSGVIGQIPQWVYIETNDTQATVTTVGYLNGAAHEFINSLRPNMMALVSTKTSQSVGVAPVLYLLQVTNNNGVWSLVAPAVDVPVPFIVPGNIQAGLSGTAGAFLSYPSTPLKGFLELAAVANTGNTATIINNAAMGQASTITIPDPGNAAANFLLSRISAGNQIINTGGLQVANGTLIVGTNGGAQSLTIFPATMNQGNLTIRATNNTGNTSTVITNAAMGQGTVVTIPDPGAATANFVLNTGATTMAAGSSITLAKVNGSESSNAVTANGTAGFISTSALTTAGGASYAITWTNSFLTATSVVLLTFSGGTNTTQDITLTMVPGSGTGSLTIYNNTAATALNGTIRISYLVV